MPVLFLATMAGDAEVIRKLLLCGARTDIPLQTEVGILPVNPQFRGNSEIESVCQK